MIFFAAACTTASLHVIAQNPPVPSPLVSPVPAIPPVPLVAPLSERVTHPAGRDRSSIYLGVDVAPVPAAMSDQLNLAEGFGLLVDYVVPGSAADVAGVKAHDILRLLNDQILTGEGQLSVLVRSFSEGQDVTLVVLRKGQETRLTAKLQKRQNRADNRPAGREPQPGKGDWAPRAYGNFHLDLDNTIRLQDLLRSSETRAEAATEQAKEQVERAKKALLEVRARSGRFAGSRADFDNAQILMRDSAGRVELRSSRGKRKLTLRDQDGKTIFDGPIDTPEQRKAIPADLLPQVEALEREQATTFTKSSDSRNADEGENADWCRRVSPAQS